MLESISRILFIVSTSALVPVILALLGLAAWTLLILGGFLRECIARKSSQRILTPDLSRLKCNDPHAAAGRLAQQADNIKTGFLPRYLRDCWASATNDTAARKVVDDIELEMLHTTTSLTTLARLGPMLGLAGTLIPLAPGLVSLARGDVTGLANQLVIAFSTTIVGLLVGVISFACAHARRGWYARDLASILLLEDLRAGNGSSNGGGNTL